MSGLARRGKTAKTTHTIPRRGKKNFLRGLELTDFSAIQAAAQVWLDTIANVRIHKETHLRPVDLFQEERLGRLNPNRYDVARTTSTRASSQCRITVDANHYSVPCAYAHRRLTAKLYPDRVAIYFDAQLIARHTRSYSHHIDIEDPEHAKGLIAQRMHAREQRLMLRFLPAYSPDLNPIEQVFSKLEAALRKGAARTVTRLLHLVGHLAKAFGPKECANYFGHAGYGP